MTFLYITGFVIGALIIIRSFLLLFYAEMGRRHDLVKHTYKGGTDFNIAVLIPFLDARKISALRDLVKTLERQDYPTARIGVHIVANEESIFGFSSEEDLSPIAKVWTYPNRKVSRGESLSWLAERLLASGGPSKLFVFLDADDIVRPDFLRNVTSRSFDCFVMQGYLALKRPPRGLFARLYALSVRLMNRIENAGRFHMGLSSQLMQSGWVVRQEILEMFPYRQGKDFDNIEYTMMLNMQGYRVNWAPNVVVYRNEKVSFSQLMRQLSSSLLNRFRLAARYVVPLLFKGVGRFDLNLFEEVWLLLKPPHFLLGFIGLAGAWYTYVQGWATGSYIFSALTLIYFGSQLISLVVARCNLQDTLAFVIGTPIAYAIGAVSLPFFFLLTVAESVFKMGGEQGQKRVGLRFDESLPSRAVSQEYHSDPIGVASLAQHTETEWDNASLYSLEQNLGGVGSKTNFAHPPQPLANHPPLETVMPQRDQQILVGQERAHRDEHTRQVPITNGKHVVESSIRTIIEQARDGETYYELVFEYKSLSFKTKRYRILDQAYYELQTRLKSKGFSMTSCGSCAYFYHPTAANTYGIAKEQGFCLFNKLGQDLSFDDDAVTVLSSACQHYTDVSRRSLVVQRWQQSLEEREALLSFRFTKDKYLKLNNARA